MYAAFAINEINSYDLSFEKKTELVILSCIHLCSHHFTSHATFSTFDRKNSAEYIRAIFEHFPIAKDIYYTCPMIIHPLSIGICSLIVCYKI